MADVTMPLTAHLEELRWRLIKVLAAIGLGFLVSYAFADALVSLLTRPLLSMNPGDAGAGSLVELIGTGVVEAFFTKLKVSAIAGLFLGSPVVFFQLWMFVAPGLYDNEKRLARPFVFFGTLFFVSGAAFCYAAVLPVAYRFFIEQYGSIQVKPQIRIGEYLTFTSRMLLAFGVTFEMPVATFFLARIGLVDHRMMVRSLRYAILVIFVVAAVLTPGPDVASQLLMAAPLLLLYGVSIGVAFLFARKRPGTQDAAEKAAAAGGDGKSESAS